MKPDLSLVFGWHPVLEALAAGKEVQRIYLLKGIRGERQAEVLEAARDRDIPVQFVPSERLDRFTRKNHQGVIAMLSPVEYADLSNLVHMLFSEGKVPALLLLDHVTDVGNFGAACRSAEALGFHAVIIPSAGGAPLNEDAVRVSSGALLRLPVCRVARLKDAVRDLKDSGVFVVGMTEKANSSISELKTDAPICLVLGNEETGISDDILKACDSLVRIPLTGSTASLNVSAAAAIAMYAVMALRES